MDDISDYQLLINLLNIQNEPIEDEETAMLIVERSLYHFVRLTTSRRNNRQIVAEEEIIGALQIAENIFRNPSLLSEEFLQSSTFAELVDSCVLVMLNELLCFIDFSGEDENARKNDPPSLHVRRIMCAIDLMQRISSSRNSSSLLFRKTLPGVASRTTTNISTIFNSTASNPSTKHQRESCVFCLELLFRHLKGCDFKNWMMMTMKNNNADGLSSFVRVCGLVESTFRTVINFLVSYVSNPSNLSFSAWLNNADEFRRLVFTKFDDLINFIIGDEFLELASSSSEVTSDKDRRVMVEKSYKSLRVVAHQMLLLNRKFFGSTSQKKLMSSKIVDFVTSHFDEICFGSQSKSKILNIMMYSCCADFKQITSPERQQRLFRQIVSSIAFALEDLNVVPTDEDHEEDISNNHKSSSSSALASLDSIAKNQLSGNSSVKSSSSSTSLNLFEKWLTTFYDPNSTNFTLAFLQPVSTGSNESTSSSPEESLRLSSSSSFSLSSSPIPYLLSVATKLVKRGSHFFDDAVDDSDDLSHQQDNILEILQNWLEETAVPILEDPHLYSKHHAVLLLLLSVFYSKVILTNDEDEDLSTNSSTLMIKLLDEEFTWSECWSETIWERIILCPHLRNVSSHWELCSGAQKRFRASIAGMICKLITVFGCGMAQQAVLLAESSKNKKKSNKRKKNNKKQSTADNFLSDAAERFLLLAVRELLDMASTEYDSITNVLNQTAMNSLKMIAGAFFPSSSSSSLQSLIRHCLPSITEVCSRQLTSPTSSMSDKISNARILLASTKLSVFETLQVSTQESLTRMSHQLSKTSIVELSAQIQSIGSCCYELLRKYNDEDCDIDENTMLISSSSKQITALRLILFKIAVTVTEFATNAQRTQDKSWNIAVSNFISNNNINENNNDEKEKSTKEARSKSFNWKKGNVIRHLYQRRILQKEAAPGQVNLIPKDETEWMETEDFTAFVEPFVAKLHENSLHLLSCAVASLNTQYKSTASTISNPAALGVNFIEKGGKMIKKVAGDSSLLKLEGKSSVTQTENGDDSFSADNSIASKRWNMMLSTTDAVDAEGSAKDAIMEKRREEMRKRAKFSSVAERVAAIQLAMSCLASVCTSTPVTYFEPATTVVSEEDEDDDKTTIITKQHKDMKEKLRISKSHWTSVFKVFYSLQSLLLSSSSSNSDSFRDMNAGIQFFFEFTDTLRQFRRENNNENNNSNNNLSTKLKDQLRIKLKNLSNSIKTAKLIADESIAQTPQAFEFLLSIATSFLLYRTQCEVLPLLALHWITLCQEKEPEVWSGVIMSSSQTSSSCQTSSLISPRTQLGKKFLQGFLSLAKASQMKKEKEESGEEEHKKTNDDDLPTAADDVTKVRRGLEMIGLMC